MGLVTSWEQGRRNSGQELNRSIDRRWHIILINMWIQGRAHLSRVGSPLFGFCLTGQGPHARQGRCVLSSLSCRVCSAGCGGVSMFGGSALMLNNSGPWLQVI